MTQVTAHILKVAGGVIVSPDHNIIVVRQKGNSWSLPKGHVEKHETIFDAAIREIEEETGLLKSQLTFIRALPEYTRTKISKDGTDEIIGDMRTMNFFLFTTEQEHTLSPKDTDNPEARWVNIEEAVALLSHKKDKEFITSIASIIN